MITHKDVQIINGGVMKFRELPKVYQDKINRDIADVYGDEYPEIISAYKEWEAGSLSE